MRGCDQRVFPSTIEKPCQFESSKGTVQSAMTRESARALPILNPFGDLKAVKGLVPLAAETHSSPKD